MKIFKQLSARLFWFGIHFDELELSPKRRTKSLVSKWIFFVDFLILFVTSICFYLYEPQTPMKRSEISICVLSSGLFIVWYFNFLWNGLRYTALYSELTTIIEKSKIE